MHRMKQGKAKYLTEEDLWSLPPDDTAEALGTKLERHWKRRQAAAKLIEGGKASLPRALFGAYGRPFVTAAVFKLLQDILAFAQPQLLRRLLIFVATYKTATPEPAFHGYLIAGGMFVTAITQTVRALSLPS